MTTSTTDCFYEKFPKAVVMEITTRCNLNCSYCSARKLIQKPSDISLEKVQVLADRLNEVSLDFIALCGMGEPLIHKKFYEVMEILKDQQIVLVSNGSMAINYERLTKHGNIHIITFSVDGATEKTLKKVCDGYNKDLLLKNLVKANEYGVNISFNVTLSPDNINELEDILNLGIKHNVIYFKFGLPLGQEKWVNNNVKDISFVLSHIEKKAKELNLDYENPFKKKCTHANAPSALLVSNGDFYPCCDYYSCRPSTGNLFKTNFKSMWENKIYEDFRTGYFCSDCSRYHNNTELKAKLLGD